MRDLCDTLVVFDWNGTIMNDVPRATLAINAVLRTYSGTVLSEDDLRRTFRLPMTRWMSDLAVPDAHLREAALQWSAETTTTPAPAKDDAREVLTGLRRRGAMIGIASAAERDSVDADARRADLVELVDLFAAGVSDKAEYLRSIRHHRRRAVYIGDCEYDTASARSAEFEAVAVADGYRSADVLASAGPDVVLPGLAELLEYLR